MKEKVKAMLKEMYLLQSADGGELFDNLISLAQDMYCELNGISKEDFIKKHLELWDLVWSGYPTYPDDWKRRQELYRGLLDNLLNQEGK